MISPQCVAWTIQRRFLTACTQIFRLLETRVHCNYTSGTIHQHGADPVRSDNKISFLARPTTGTTPVSTPTTMVNTFEKTFSDRN